MKIFWIFSLAFLRPIYFIYSLLCLLVPITILYGTAYGFNALFFQSDFPSLDFILNSLVKFTLIVFIALAIYIPIMVFRRKSTENSDTNSISNPFQNAFMSWFATLRWYWNTSPGSMAKVGLPSGYLVANPMNYRLTAKDMRDILNKIQPGDILLRAYDGYLDGEFIRRSSLCSKNGYRTGWFTHAAMYVGELNETDRKKVPKKFQNNRNYFQEGPQMVIHSMAKGVHTEDILTWFRCDYMAVLRVKSEIQATHKVDLSTLLSHPLPKDLPDNDPINHNEIIQSAKLSALEKIGEPYDFECISTNKFDRFSCAELVYYCYRSINNALGFFPQLHALYPLGKLNRHWYIMGRTTVTPDDFYDLAKENQFDIVWVDKISKRKA